MKLTFVKRTKQCKMSEAKCYRPYEMLFKTSVLFTANRKTYENSQKSYGSKTETNVRHLIVLLNFLLMYPKFQSLVGIKTITIFILRRF